MKTGSRHLFVSLIFFLLLCRAFPALAQTDSISVTDKTFRLHDGLYPDWSSFRSNHPLPKGKLVTDYDTTTMDFLRRITQLSTITYKDTGGREQKMATSKFWGFCENGSLYVYFSGNFQRVTIVGSLCHFTAEITTYMYTGSPVGYGGMNGAPVVQMEQFMLDANTGTFYQFHHETMSTFLTRDQALSKEFEALSKKKKKQSVFLFLRRYNEKHPLRFPA